MCVRRLVSCARCAVERARGLPRLTVCISQTGRASGRRGPPSADRKRESESTSRASRCLIFVRKPHLSRNGCDLRPSRRLGRRLSSPILPGWTIPVADRRIMLRSLVCLVSCASALRLQATPRHAPALMTTTAAPPTSKAAVATPDAISADAPLHVLIAGAGVGGLALANCIELAGNDHVTYTVLECAPALPRAHLRRTHWRTHRGNRLSLCCILIWSDHQSISERGGLAHSSMSMLLTAARFSRISPVAPQAHPGVSQVWRPHPARVQRDGGLQGH